MKHGLVLAAAAAVVAMVSCGGGEQSAPDQQADRSTIDEAYSVIDELYDNEASDDEKLEASIEFLERFPESDHTMQLIGDLFYFMGDQRGDFEGAVAFAETIRHQVSDPEIGTDFDRRLITWYGNAGLKAKMLTIADTLEAKDIIRFGDYYRVIQSAIAMQEWDLAREYCSKATSKATAATWRAEWPDVEATDEEAQRAGLNRQGMLLVQDSWATANL